MKINSIQSTTFDAKARIKSIDNKKHPYLYNEVCDLVKAFRIPANFKNKEIELPSVSVDVFRKLNELKIRFTSK